MGGRAQGWTPLQLNRKEKEILEYSTRKTDYANFLTPLWNINSLLCSAWPVSLSTRNNFDLNNRWTSREKMTIIRSRYRPPFLLTFTHGYFRQCWCDLDWEKSLLWCWSWTLQDFIRTYGTNRDCTRMSSMKEYQRTSPAVLLEAIILHERWFRRFCCILSIDFSGLFWSGVDYHLLKMIFPDQWRFPNGSLTSSDLRTSNK
jgi:hypothetical protein